MRSTWPGEVAVCLAFRVGELDLHAVRAISILIHQHHGPLPVGSLDDIGRHQQVSERVA